MTAKTHNAIAFASLLALASYYVPENINVTTLGLSLVGVSMGALIPDMDQAGNALWNLLPGRHSVGRIFRKVFYKHRTITHSVLGVYLIYKFLDFLFHKIFNPGFIDPNIILASVMIGFVSHLLADSFTEEGLPLFFPLKFTFGIPPIKKVRIKTGKWFENLIIFPSVWVFVVYLLVQKKEIFLMIIQNISK